MHIEPELKIVFTNSLSIFIDGKVASKVQIFWEGHENLHNLPNSFEIYLVNIKTMKKIVQIFVTFSEKLNFTRLPCLEAQAFSDFLWKVNLMFIYCDLLGKAYFHIINMH